MAAIWSSSERPISVRTVWVDGVRHAILSADDPIANKKVVENDFQKRRRSRPTTSVTTTRRVTNSSRSSGNYTDTNHFYQAAEDLELDVDVEEEAERNYYENDLRECLVKLRRVVVDGNEKNPSSYYSPRILSKSAGRRSFIPKANNRNENSDNLKPRMNFGLVDNDKTSRDFYSGKLICKDPGKGDEVEEVGNCSKLPEIQENSLSERVLQWLDISGRVKNYERNEELDDNNCRGMMNNFFHRKKITPTFFDNGINNNNNNNKNNFDLNRKIRSSSAAVVRNHKKEERNILVQQNYTLKTTQDFDTETEKGKEPLNRFRDKEKFRSGDRTANLRPASLGNNNDRQCSFERSIIFDNNDDDEEENEEDYTEGRQSLWSPPKKPQLHIFMPSLIITRNNNNNNQDKITSSLETSRD